LIVLLHNNYQVVRCFESFGGYKGKFNTHAISRFRDMLGWLSIGLHARSSNVDEGEQPNPRGTLRSVQGHSSKNPMRRTDVVLQQGGLAIRTRATRSGSVHDGWLLRVSVPEESPRRLREDVWWEVWSTLKYFNFFSGLKSGLGVPAKTSLWCHSSHCRTARGGVQAQRGAYMEHDQKQTISPSLDYNHF
jgi:hypothetical protein